MDEHTPIDVPIRLEEWDRHDYINEVDTIVVDIRPIRIGQPDASVRGDAWLSAKETEDES